MYFGVIPIEVYFCFRYAKHKRASGGKEEIYVVCNRL